MCRIMDIQFRKMKIKNPVVLKKKKNLHWWNNNLNPLWLHLALISFEFHLLIKSLKIFLELNMKRSLLFLTLKYTYICREIWRYKEIIFMIICKSMRLERYIALQILGMLVLRRLGMEMGWNRNSKGDVSTQSAHSSHTWIGLGIGDFTDASVATHRFSHHCK